MKFVSISLIIILILLLLYFIYNKDVSGSKEINYKIDTIVKIVPQKEIKIVESRPRIRYIKDTIIITKPFVAQLDTIIQRDTVFALFHFPENTMSINVRTSTDSIRMPQITIEKTKYERNWYEIAVALGGGFIFGLILGK